MSSSNKRQRPNDSQSHNDHPNKKRKLNKQKTPKNVINYWVNKQLSGKYVLIRHGSNYQIATFTKISKSHALVVTAYSKVELSIKWKFVYPIIDHKFNYVSLIKQNGDDNVHRIVTNVGEYEYIDTLDQKHDPNGKYSIKIDKDTDWCSVEDYYVDFENVYFPQLVPLIPFTDCDIMSKITSNKKSNKRLSDSYLSQYFPTFDQNGLVEYVQSNEIQTTLPIPTKKQKQSDISTWFTNSADKQVAASLRQIQSKNKNAKNTNSNNTNNTTKKKNVFQKLI
eukprot:301528_1